MSNSIDYSLWKHFSQTRYFLIPISYQLIEGECVLQRLDGTERKVDSATLAPFEVTETVAADYLKAKSGEVFNQIGDASKKHLESFLQPTFLTNQEVNGAQSIINSVATLLGVTPVELQQDSSSMRERLCELLSHIKAELSQIIIDDEEASEASQLQLNVLQETLQSRGINIKKVLEELPEALQELVASTDDELVLAEVATVLPDFLQQLERSPTSIEELLNQTMQMLLQKLDQPMSDEEMVRVQEERQQAYEQSAQEAIDSVLEVPSVPSLESLMQQLGYLDQQI